MVPVLTIERVIEMLDPWIANAPPNLTSRFLIIVEAGHLNPNDAHADVNVGKVLQHRLLHRTGAINAARSCRREYRNKPMHVLISVEMLAKWIKRVAQDRYLPQDTILRAIANLVV